MALVRGLHAYGPLAGSDAVCGVGDVVQGADESPGQPVRRPAAHQKRERERASERNGEEEEILLVGRHVVADGELEAVGLDRSPYAEDDAAVMGRVAFLADAVIRNVLLGAREHRAEDRLVRTGVEDVPAVRIGQQEEDPVGAVLFDVLVEEVAHLSHVALRFGVFPDEIGRDAREELLVFGLHERPRDEEDQAARQQKDECAGGKRDGDDVAPEGGRLPTRGHSRIPLRCG